MCDAGKLKRRADVLGNPSTRTRTYKSIGVYEVAFSTNVFPHHGYADPCWDETRAAATTVDICEVATFIPP